MGHGNVIVNPATDRGNNSRPASSIGPCRNLSMLRSQLGHVALSPYCNPQEKPLKARPAAIPLVRGSASTDRKDEPYIFRISLPYGRGTSLYNPKPPSCPLQFIKVPMLLLTHGGGHGYSVATPHSSPDYTLQDTTFSQRLSVSPSSSSSPSCSQLAVYRSEARQRPVRTRKGEPVDFPHLFARWVAACALTTRLADLLHGSARRQPG